MKNVLQNPMINVLRIPDIENRKSYLREMLQIIHTIYSPIASSTKSFSATVSLLLKNETFGIKNPVILKQVSYIDVPNFIKENKEKFISPLIFGSDYKWFEQQQQEVFTKCLTDTIVVFNTLYENKGVYLIDEDEFLSEFKDKTGFVTFAIHT
jgi:hypothetical protein